MPSHAQVCLPPEEANQKARQTYAFEFKTAGRAFESD
jgi:hypothetical protein